jgi:hypothetical protein
VLSRFGKVNTCSVVGPRMRGRQDGVASSGRSYSNSTLKSWRAVNGITTLQPALRQRLFARMLLQEREAG